MKRFRFQLQTVHDLRETRRDEAERSLAEAAQQVFAAAAQLDDANRSLTEAAENYAAMLGDGALDAHEASLRASYLITLTRRREDARTRLAAVEREREVRRQVVVEASRAAEATAKLRERQSARHALETARDEQNNLDEMATSATARRLRN